MNYIKKNKNKVFIITFLLAFVSFQQIFIGEVIAAGEDDIYEENDSFSSAKEINPGYYNLTLNDTDWFNIWLEEGDEISIDLNYNPIDAVNISLWNASNYWLEDAHYMSEGWYELNWTAANKGYYYLEVYGDYFGEFYYLNISINKTNYNGIFIDQLEHISGYDDENITLNWTPYLYGVFTPDYCEIVDVGNGYQSLENKSYSNATEVYYNLTYWAPGNYSIGAYFYTLEGEIGFCSIEIEIFSRNSTDDWAEENDDYWNGTEIFPNPDDFLSNLVQSDYDYFNVSVPADKEFNVLFECEFAEISSFHLNDIDPFTGALIRSEKGENAITNNMTLQFGNSGMHENYIIMVNGSDQGYKYNLTFSTGDMSSEYIYIEQPDYISGFEDEIITLTWTPYLYGALTPDYCEIVDVNAGYQSLENKSYSNATEVYYNLTYWAPGNYTIGAYFYTFEGEEGFCTIDIEIFSKDDDWAEENDIFDDACELIPDYHGNLIQNDTDWYKINLTANEPMSIYIDSSDPINISLHGMDSTYGWLANFQEDGPFYYSLDWGPSYSGWHYINVSGSNVGANYSIDIFLANDDWAEENDFFENAYELIPDYHGNLIQYDADLFKINMNESMDIYINSSDPLDISWFDGTYIWLADFNEDNPNTYSLHWDPSYSGWFYIEVLGNDIGADYFIDIWPDSIPTEDDWAEENDNLMTAALIESGYYGNLICKDDDWFEFGPVHDQETLIVELQFDKIWNLNLELFDSTGAPHGYSIFEETWGKRLEWSAAGYFESVFIKVSGDFDTYYDLYINFSTGEIDDWAEENDLLNDAYPLDEGDHDGLICNDDDWYLFGPFSDQDLLVVDLHYDKAAWNLNIELYNQYGDQLTYDIFDESFGKTLEWISSGYVENAYIKIYGDYGANYDLFIDVSPNDQTDDGFEENDDWDQSTVLITGHYENLRQFDDDFYLLEFDLNQTLIFDISADAELTFELYDENQVLVGSLVFEGHQTVKCTNDVYGFSVYIKVTGDNNGVQYNFDIKFEEESDIKSSTNGTGDNPLENFDFSSIPGFPIEIIGGITILSMIVIIFYIKKKK